MEDPAERLERVLAALEEKISKDAAKVGCKDVAKTPLQISLLAAIPVTTIIAWLWIGAGYAKDIDRHTSELSENKAIVQRIDAVNRQQEVAIGEMRAMFEATSQNIKDLREDFRRNANKRQ